VLEDISETLFPPLPQFFLSMTPVPETISVTVDYTGTDDWLYDELGNYIYFEEGLEPEAGSTVIVNYMVYESCI